MSDFEAKASMMKIHFDGASHSESTKGGNMLFHFGDTALVVSFDNMDERRAFLRQAARQLAEAAGEQLACDLTESEARALYHETAW
jgi:hypothetical protein